MTTTFAYDSEGDLSKTTEQMPAGQQRITIAQNDTVNDPSIGISARQRSTVNGILCFAKADAGKHSVGYAIRPM